MKPPRHPTIADVAEAAGVAQSTVSRVLNGGYASDPVERKVRAAIERLDYSPSAAARNLKLNRTGIIGLVAASSQAPWLTLLLGGIEEALARHRASVALCSLELDGHYSDDPVRNWIEARRVDGIIFVRPTPRELELVRLAEDSGLPHVHLVPDHHFEGGPRLTADNLMAGRLAGEHLLGFEHETVAFIAAAPTSVDSNARLEGLRGALGQRGWTLPPERVWYGGGYDVESGRQAAARYLHNPQLRAATAVVLANDAMALGFMHGVQRAGLRIPTDVSVVGFDDVPAAELVWPGLTTVAQPVRRMGDEAAELLLSGEALQNEPDRAYPTLLIARQSTDRPRRACR